MGYPAAILSHMPGLFQLGIVCFLALIAMAQWLDWKSGIQEGPLNRHYGRRGV
jgi:hypothetical protein